MIRFLLGIPARLKLYAAAILAAAMGALAIYAKGRSDAGHKAEVRDLKGYKATTERMQDADAAIGDDPAALRERLRDRNPKQR